MAFENNALGVDVSLWQPNVDWAALRNAGVSFAFAKATEADNVTDPQFAKNWPGMKAAGVVRGAYHFFRPAKDPLKQAAFFTNTAKLEAGDLPLALDLESSGNLAPGPLVQSILACLNEIERLSGRRPIIYTGPNFWNTSVAAPNPPDWAAGYALWIANYTSGPKPTVPKGWTDWKLWQYTESGKFPGLTGNFDLDRFNGTVADLVQWVGLSAQPQPAAQAQPQLQPQPAADSGLAPKDLIANYIQALNARDFDGLMALYKPAGLHSAASGTVQGTAGIRVWYQDWLTNTYPGGSFSLGAVNQVAPASWSFAWTCHSSKGDGQGQDTLGLADGLIQYHATN